MKLKWPRYARLSEVRNDQDAWKGVFGTWSKAIFYNGEVTGPMWGSKIKSEPKENRERPECFASGLIQTIIAMRRRLYYSVPLNAVHRSPHNVCDISKSHR